MLRAERSALEQQLMAEIVDGERFGAQVGRLCDAFGTAQKKMIAGADLAWHKMPVCGSFILTGGPLHGCDTHSSATGAR